MERKIILITGATSGIGKASALALAEQGHELILHGRNAKKTADTRDEIVGKTGNLKIDILVADLTLLKETREMVREFKLRYGRLDVLINNAGGIMSNIREVTVEGHERTLALNLLSPFLLTNLLLDHLKQSTQGRIINVSSSSHRIDANPDFDDIPLRQQYNPRLAYGNSKLFLIWVTQHLARLLRNDGQLITVNAMHPGAVATNFGMESDLGIVLRTFVRLARPFFRTVEKGADTMIYLATSEDVDRQSGLYFVDRMPAKVSQRYYSPEAEEFIWEYCSGFTGTDYGMD